MDQMPIRIGATVADIRQVRADSLGAQHSWLIQQVVSRHGSSKSPAAPNVGVYGVVHPANCGSFVEPSAGDAIGFYKEKPVLNGERSRGQGVSFFELAAG